MKDPTDELMVALFTELDGNVTYNSNTIPVYTKLIPWDDRSEDQFIQLADFQLTEDGAKDANISRGTATIYVDTFFEGKEAGSWTPANSISNSITQLIDKKFTLTSFTQIVGRVGDIFSPDYELDDGGSVFRKMITYHFTIQEN